MILCDDKAGNLLTGMVGSGMIGIVPVICGDYNQVALVDFPKKSTKPKIEFAEARSVSLRIAAVPVERIEIEEVGENKLISH